MNVGETIQERYQIEEILGQGGMGVTYKALDLKMQRPVAVKLLHFSRMQEWKTLELFEREAKILQQLTHPQIPAYVDYVAVETPSDVQFILVQEYIEGKTLQQLVEEGWNGAEEDILDIVRQLVKILEYLHTLKPPVIHRDINPKNILLSPDNKVYLVDFGAVRERIRTTFLGGSTIVGTFGYAPFEQFSGQATPASDYYALGATLLYLLTHRHPVDFPKQESSIQFHSYLPPVSPQLIRLLDGLLEPSVEERLASPEVIQKLLRGQPDILRADKREVPGIPQIQKIPRPHRTKIKKTFKAGNRVSFHIPGNKKMGVGFIIFGTIFLGAVGFLSFLLPEFSWKEVLTLFLAFFPPEFDS